MSREAYLCVCCGNRGHHYEKCLKFKSSIKKYIKLLKF